MKTRLLMIAIWSTVFQFILGYYFDITLKYTPGIWWIITVLFCLIAPFFQRAMADWIHLQIALHRERAQRRRDYEQFKKDWHDGLMPESEFEEVAKEVIK